MRRHLTCWSSCVFGESNIAHSHCLTTLVAVYAVIENLCCTHYVVLDSTKTRNQKRLKGFAVSAGYIEILKVN